MHRLLKIMTRCALDQTSPNCTGVGYVIHGPVSKLAGHIQSVSVDVALAGGMAKLPQKFDLQEFYYHYHGDRRSEIHIDDIGYTTMLGCVVLPNPEYRQAQAQQRLDTVLLRAGKLLRTAAQELEGGGHRGISVATAICEFLADPTTAEALNATSVRP